MARKQHSKPVPTKWIESHVRNVDVTVVVLLAIAVLAVTIHTIVAYDVWWQVAAGEWIAGHGWPTTDPFSYGFPDRPWIELRWIWCLSLYQVDAWFGPNGIIGLRIVLVSSAFALLWQATSKAPTWARSLACGVALLAGHLRFTDRPEAASFVFLAAMLFLLDRYRRTGKIAWIAALPILQALWVNTHTVFAIGPVAVGLYASAEVAAGLAPWPGIRALAMARRRALILVALAVLMVLACLVNPWGINGPLFAMRVFGQLQSGNAVADIITELKSPLGAPGFTVAFLRLPIVAGVSFAILALSFRRLQPGGVALWGAFLYLAVLSDRNLALFGFVAGYVLAAHCVALKEAAAEPMVRSVAWTSRLACGVLALISIVALATDAYYVRIDPARRFGFGIADGRFPIRAMAFVEQHKFPGRILCNFADGNVILRERVRQSVYIDGRLEVYSPQTLTDVVSLFRTGKGFQETVARYGISIVVLTHATDGAIFRVVNRSPAWTPVYFDATHSVFVRPDDASRAAVETMRVDWANPVAPEVTIPARYIASDPLRGLWPRVPDDAAARSFGTFALLIGNLELARQQFETAFGRRPDPSTALQLGIVCRALGDDARANAVLAQAGGDGTRVGTALSAAHAFEGADSLEAAASTYEILVARGDAGTEALTRLARVRLALGQKAAALTAAQRALAIEPANKAARQVSAAAQN